MNFGKVSVDDATKGIRDALANIQSQSLKNKELDLLEQERKRQAARQAKADSWQQKLQARQQAEWDKQDAINQAAIDTPKNDLENQLLKQINQNTFGQDVVQAQDGSVSSGWVDKNILSVGLNEDGSYDSDKINNAFISKQNKLAQKQGYADWKVQDKANKGAMDLYKEDYADIVYNPQNYKKILHDRLSKIKGIKASDITNQLKLVDSLYPASSTGSTYTRTAKWKANKAEFDAELDVLKQLAKLEAKKDNSSSGPSGSKSGRSKKTMFTGIYSMDPKVIAGLVGEGWSYSFINDKLKDSIGLLNAKNKDNKTLNEIISGKVSTKLVENILQLNVSDNRKMELLQDAASAYENKTSSSSSASSLGSPSKYIKQIKELTKQFKLDNGIGSDTKSIMTQQKADALKKLMDKLNEGKQKTKAKSSDSEGYQIPKADYLQYLYKIDFNNNNQVAKTDPLPSVFNSLKGTSNSNEVNVVGGTSETNKNDTIDFINNKIESIRSDPETGNEDAVKKIQKLEKTKIVAEYLSEKELAKYSNKDTSSKEKNRIYRNALKLKHNQDSQDSKNRQMRELKAMIQGFGVDQNTAESLKNSVAPYGNPGNQWQKDLKLIGDSYNGIKDVWYGLQRH
jgi:hypothetical protein